jgi:hypothetical protein
VQVARQVRLVAKNANDQDIIVFDPVDDVMTGVVMNAHGRLILDPFRCETWVVCEKANDVPQVLLVPVGLGLPEIQEAVEITVDDIGIG